MKKWLAVLVLIPLMFLGACGNASKEKITLQAGHVVDENHPYQHGLEKFKEIVEKKLKDRIEVEIYHSGQLGEDRVTIEGMKMGSVDMAVTSSAPLSGFIPEIGVFELPYLFDSNEAAYEVLDGEVGDYYTDLLKEQGIINLGYFENGFRHITNSKRPIETPDDLKGIKIRVMENQVAVETFKTVGANATPMAWSEVFTALQQGTIDAQENPIPVIYGQGLYEVQDYLTLSKHFYSPAVFMISEKSMAKFTEEEQDIIRKAAKEATEYERQVSQDQANEYIDLLKEKGMQISEVDTTEFREAMQPVYDQFMSEYNPDILKKILGE
jgi:TRAP-type transport system periplasmic protein